MPPRPQLPTKDPTPLAGPLAAAAEKSPGGVKPDALTAEQSDKKNYAQRLSNELALVVAAAVRPRYNRARVTPFVDGRGQEYTVGASIDKKRTDVAVWDDAAGLVLGVSIKTLSFRDRSGKGKAARLGRYIKNIKRNDMELRDEADVLHRRQPFAVLAAMMFLPEDACWDAGTEKGHSSFAHIVFTLRKRTGRRDPHTSRPDLFERVFVGLYDETGRVGFFDVTRPPRRNQKPDPSELLSLGDVVDELVDSVTLRNTGSLPADRYSEDDPSWQPPSRVDLAFGGPPLMFDDTLWADSEDAEDEPDDDAGDEDTDV